MLKTVLAVRLSPRKNENEDKHTRFLLPTVTREAMQAIEKESKIL